MGSREKNEANILRPGERGSALVITLWITLILCVIALEVAYSTRLELRTLDYGRHRLQSDELARSAAGRALSWLSDSRNRTRDRVVRLDHDRWRTPPVAAAADLPINIIQDDKGTEAGSYSVEISDVSGKINVNTADKETLSRLFALRGINASEQLADIIVNYRATRPGAALLSLDDLLNVPGIDSKILYGEDTNDNGVLDPNENDGKSSAPDDNADGVLNTGIAEVLTVSPHALISINRAPEEIVASILGLTEGQAKEFTRMRTDASGRFLSLDELKAIPGIDQERLDKLGKTFSLESDRFNLRVRAASAGGAVPKEVSAVIAVSNGVPAIFTWREK